MQNVNSCSSPCYHGCSILPFPSGPHGDIARAVTSSLVRDPLTPGILGPAEAYDVEVCGRLVCMLAWFHLCRLSTRMDITAKVLHIVANWMVLWESLSEWWLNHKGFSEASEGCPAAGCADIPLLMRLISLMVTLDEKVGV